MLVYESKRYRIEEHTGLPKRYSVDYKRVENNRVALINIGWRDWRHEAFELMNKHSMESNDVTY